MHRHSGRKDSELGWGVGMMTYRLKLELAVSKRRMKLMYLTH